MATNPHSATPVGDCFHHVLPLGGPPGRVPLLVAQVRVGVADHVAHHGLVRRGVIPQLVLHHRADVLRLHVRRQRAEVEDKILWGATGVS